VSPHAAIARHSDPRRYVYLEALGIHQRRGIIVARRIQIDDLPGRGDSKRLLQLLEAGDMEVAAG